jgi:hypothetical protein
MVAPCEVRILHPLAPQKRPTFVPRMTPAVGWFSPSLCFAKSRCYVTERLRFSLKAERSESAPPHRSLDSRRRFPFLAGELFVSIFHHENRDCSFVRFCTVIGIRFLAFQTDRKGG